MPVSVASQIGVLRIRSCPNRSCRPRMSPTIDSSTSSPYTTTLGLRSISSTRASWTASSKRLRAMALRPLSAEHQRQGELRIGGLPRLRELHRRSDTLPDACVERVKSGGVRDPGADQPACQPGDRVAGPPLVDLGALPVATAGQDEALRLEVTLNAIRAGLNERG